MSSFHIGGQAFTSWRTNRGSGVHPQVGNHLAQAVQSVELGDGVSPLTHYWHTYQLAKSYYSLVMRMSERKERLIIFRTALFDQKWWERSADVGEETLVLIE